MELNWKESSQPGVMLEADYPAYPTPEGDAVATAYIKHIYTEYEYETWIHDPYLASVGASDYAKFCYGSEMELESAKSILEEFGVRSSRSFLHNWDVREAYERAFPKMLKRFLETKFGDDVFYRVVEANARDFEAYVDVEEGGYEWAHHRVIWDHETFGFRDYVS